MLIKVITQSKLTSQAHLFCFDRPVQKHRELTSLRTELSLNQKETSKILLQNQHSRTIFPCYLVMEIYAKTQLTVTKIVELGN